MKTARLLALFGIWAILVSAVDAQVKSQRAGRAYPPRMPGAKVEVYKETGDIELKMYIFQPSENSDERRAAIVFFFGGGWRSGSPAQFSEHCKYLASRGMVAVAADYRVSSRHGTKAYTCVEDAKSAIRWLRANSQRLRIDPNRIVAAGGSAGGHLAACTGIVEGFEAKGEDTSISSVPNAMALFNPAVVLAPVDGKPPFDEKRVKGIAARMGVEPIKLSPLHHVRKGLPPTIVFHGTNDQTVPFEMTKAFVEAMKKSDNRCVLKAHEGKGHGFFNYGREGNRPYVQTVRQLDEFLASLEYLQGEPTIE